MNDKKIFYFGNYHNFIAFSDLYKDTIGWENIYYSPRFPCNPLSKRSTLTECKTITFPLQVTNTAYLDVGVNLNQIILVIGNNAATLEDDYLEEFKPLLDQTHKVIREDLFNLTWTDYFPQHKEEIIKPNRFKLMEI